MQPACISSATRAYAGKSHRRIAAAWIGTAFAQNGPSAAREQWREVADQTRRRLPKLAPVLDEAEADVLAFMGVAAPHRVKVHSMNSLERLNGEIKRRSDVVGIFSNDAAVTRLISTRSGAFSGPRVSPSALAP